MLQLWKREKNKHDWGTWYNFRSLGRFERKLNSTSGNECNHWKYNSKVRLNSILGTPEDGINDTEIWIWKHNPKGKRWKIKEVYGMWESGQS